KAIFEEYMEQNLFIIAGCNGAGKTTASFTILPEILNCNEFVNADEIARGLSPFQPEKVAFEAGRIMLERINDLISRKEDFAFETTLSTKSYKNKVIEARKAGYKVTLVFFWLRTTDLAIERVRSRVSEGGHNIPIETIKRRYVRGIENLFKIYMPLCDEWLMIDNSETPYSLIAEGNKDENENIISMDKWKILEGISNGK